MVIDLGVSALRSAPDQRLAHPSRRPLGGEMHAVLVSACLLGHPVRYDGGSAEHEDRILLRWAAEGRAVAVCPEVAGGLPVPRPPAEIWREAGGQPVLERKVTVRDAMGRDVTASFVTGAEQALAAATARGIRLAVLKDGSPSCGVSYTCDGSFTGRRVSAPGLTTARLRDAGIRVFSEAQLEEASLYLAQLDGEEAD